MLFRRFSKAMFESVSRSTCAGDSSFTMEGAAMVASGTDAAHGCASPHAPRQVRLAGRRGASVGLLAGPVLTPWPKATQNTKEM